MIILVSIEIVIHPTCGSSYRLQKHLHGKGILDKVKVIVADNPFIAFKYGAWSVPWITVDGKPVAADPVEPVEIEALVLGGEFRFSKNPREALEDTLLHSVYLSSVVAIWGSIDPIIQRDILSVAMRAPLTGADIEQAVRDLRRGSSDIYKELIEKINRALAVSFTRELWWLHNGELSEEQLIELSKPVTIRAWLTAKCSIGRIGLPSDPRGIAREAGAKISEFIARNARGLISRVSREQLEILNDSEYWEFISGVKSIQPTWKC